jgi:hypothetical protein
MGVEVEMVALFLEMRGTVVLLEVQPHRLELQ